MPSYTLQEDEDLIAIARRFLGDGRRWRELGYKGRPELVKPGATIHFPIDGPKKRPPLVKIGNG